MEYWKSGFQYSVRVCSFGVIYLYSTLICVYIMPIAKDLRLGDPQFEHGANIHCWNNGPPMDFRSAVCRKCASSYEAV